MFAEWYQSFLPDAVVRVDDRVDRILMYRDIGLMIDHAPHVAAPWTLMVQYLLPFDPDTAHEVWNEFIDRFLIEGPNGIHVGLTPETDFEDIPSTCRGTWLAREVGDDSRFEGLLEWVDSHYEPRLDKTRDEFAYWFGLNERYPRGQWNNTIMNALVAPSGTWSSILQ
ncbi:MAG: hypothetical protein V3S26_07970 [Acidimicrobiia bacterium]